MRFKLRVHKLKTEMILNDDFERDCYENVGKKSMAEITVGTNVTQTSDRA